MLTEGSLVTANTNRVYRIGKALGEGVTSRVYLGEDVENGERVAVKTLRQGVPDVIVSSFWLEGDLLGDLYRAEQEANDNIHSVPHVLGFKRDGDLRFIVMELVEGEPLDDRLDGKGNLEEREALAIADQFLRVLDLLHTDLRRSYTDMQLQNIWLLPNGTAEHVSIKIMDWNHVSEKPPDNKELEGTLVRQDLRRFGAYLYRMCSSKGASQQGESEKFLIQRAGECWNKISPGTQQLLVRALSPQHTSGFSTAREFRAAAQQQLEAWETDWADHLSNVQNWLGANAFDDTDAARVRNALFIAEQGGADKDKVEYYKQRLLERTGHISVRWLAGQKFFETGHYATAADLWEQEVEAHGRVELWRWVVAANAGAQMGETFSAARPLIEQAIHALESGMLANAVETIQELKRAGVKREVIEELDKETDARVQVSEARANTQSADLQLWQNALDALKGVNKLLNKHPYGELLRQEEGWGQFESEIQDLHKRIKARKETEKKIEELQAKIYGANTFEEGVAELQHQLNLDPSNQELAVMCLEWSEQFLKVKEPEKALKVLKIGLLQGQVSALDKSLRDAHQKARTHLEKQREAAMKREERAVLDVRADAARTQAELEEQEKEKARVAQTQYKQQESQEKIASQLTEAERALDQRDYVGLLKWIEQVPTSELTSSDALQRWQKIGDTVWKSFDDAVTDRTLPILNLLGQALALIDPEPKRIQTRRAKYEKAASELDAMRLHWETTFLEYIRRRRNEIFPQESGTLVQEIDGILDWATDEKFRADLQKERDSLAQFSRQRTSANESATVPVRESANQDEEAHSHKIGDLYRQIEGLNAELKTLRGAETVRARESAIKETEETIAPLDGLAFANGASLTVPSAEADLELIARVEALQSENDQLKIENQVLHERVNGLASEIAAGDEAEAHANEGLLHASDEISRLKAEVERLDTANQELAKKVELEKENARAELQTKDESRHNEIASISNRAEELRTTLEADIYNLNQKIQTIQSDLQQANTERDLSRQQTQRDAARIADLQFQLEQAQKRPSQIVFAEVPREPHSLTRLDSRAVLSDLQKEIESAFEEIEKLNATSFQKAQETFDGIVQSLSLSPDDQSRKWKKLAEQGLELIQNFKKPFGVRATQFLRGRQLDEDVKGLLEQAPGIDLLENKSVLEWIERSEQRLREAKDFLNQRNFNEANRCIRAAIAINSATKTLVTHEWKRIVPLGQGVIPEPTFAVLQRARGRAEELYSHIKADSKKGFRLLN